MRLESLEPRCMLAATGDLFYMAAASGLQLVATAPSATTTPVACGTLRTSSELRDIAVDSSGQIYGVANRTDGTTNSEVYTVDALTGGLSWVQSIVGYKNVNSLDFAGSTLYALDDDGALLQLTGNGYSKVATLDSSMGDLAYQASTGRYYYINNSGMLKYYDGSAHTVGSVGYNSVFAMDFAADGTLYAVSNQNSANPQLIRINLSTGAGTYVRTYTGLGEVWGLAAETATIDVVPSATSGLVTTESGAADTFTLTLASQPLASVTVALSSSDSTEGAVYPSSVVFTTSNWNTPQTVTVTGLSDSQTDGDMVYHVVTGSAVSDDARYNGLSVPDVEVTNQDIDPPLVTFAVASRSVAESSGTIGITVRLIGAAQSSEVTVPFTVGGSAIGGGVDYEISSSPLVFAPGETSQTIDVTIIDDSADESNETVVMNLGTPWGAGLGSTTQCVLTITDNDVVPTVQFTAASQSTMENAGAVVITAVLSGLSGQDVTVPFTLGGSATADADYWLSAGSPLTITAGQTSSAITLYLNNDTLDEEAETVVISMGTPTGATLAAPATHTVTIVDDDAPPTVQFAVASQSPYESAGTVTATVELSAASGLPVTVPFSVSGTATLDADYSISGSPLVIPAGQTTGTISISIIDDASYESSSESVAVTLGTPINATLGSPRAHTVLIQDNDPFPKVSFSTSTQSAGEGTGAMTITVELSAPSSLGVTVPFSVTGTAMGGGEDYTITASPLIIAAGQSSGTITVNMVNESILEGNETVTVTLNAPTNATLGSITTHTATIVNDDVPPLVDFTTSQQQSFESVSTFTVMAKLSTVCGLPVELPFTVSGTATGNYDDYSITASPLTIPAGETTASITITVVNDPRYEYDETVTVALVAPVNATLGNTTTHTATILNDDAMPTVQFTTGSQEDFEGVSFTITAQLSIRSGVPVSVPFTVSGTATAVGDYTIDAGPFAIPAGEESATITLRSYDDALHENNETVMVSLGTPVGANQGTTIDQTITFTDNDLPPVVQFAVGVQSAAESVGMVPVTVLLSAASGLPVTLPFTAAAAGTAMPGKDYSLSASPLTIPAGATSGTINVLLYPDQVDESDETIILTLGTPGEATLGATIVDTLTIVNAPVAQFTVSSQSGAESGTMTVTVALSAASALPITLPFTLTGTAEANVDYTASPNGEIAIPAGQTSGSVTVAVVPDGLYEHNETIVVTLGTPTNAFLGSTWTHTATIVNDDVPPSVEFALADRTVCESDGSVAITVELSAVSGAAVVLPFTVSGTAVQGSDYTLSANPLTIPAGQTTGTITLALTPDLNDESTETMALTLGAPTDATLGAQTTFAATIINAPVAQFTATSQSVGEDSTGISLTATISTVSTLPITLPYTVTGTAEFGPDYWIATGPITIPAGQLSATIAVTFLDDMRYEADETVIVTLDTPTNAVLGAKKTETVTILNNDNPPTVALTSTTASDFEFVGQVAVEVRLSAVSGLPVTIPFTVSGTATDGSDYTISGSPITIPAGEISGTININVVEDTLDEKNETVVVSLGVPTGAVLGTSQAYTMTIVDNDLPPSVEFTAASQSGEESAGTMTVTVQLSAASGLPITVPFTVTGTAGGADYTITASPITIPAGQTTATVTIALVDDGLLEPDETVIIALGAPVNASVGTIAQHTATILGSGDFPTTIGLYDPASSWFYLRDSNTSGAADHTFGYGEAGGGWIVLVGDWNGDGAQGVGLYDPKASTFYLTNAYTTGYADYTFGYGEPGGGWTPLVGDWDGDGRSGVGLYDPKSSTFYLTNTLQSGFAEYTFGYGEPNAGWKPLVGDWNGDNHTGVGLFNPHASTFYLTNALASGYAEHTFGYGEPDAGWTPMVGDWDGDHSAGVGLFAPQSSTFYLTNAFVSGYAQYTFGYGEPNAGWRPLVGDWDGNGTGGVGLYDPKASTFYLTNTLTSGYAEYTVGFGQPGGNWQPVVGYWGASSSSSAVAAVADTSTAGNTAQLTAAAVDQVNLASLLDEELGSTTGVDTQLSSSSDLAAKDIDWLMANGM
jgi:hypothetical protein